MANPNIVNVTAIYGQTAVQSVSNTATVLITNAALSNTVCKVDSLYVSNTDVASAYLITIDLYRSSTAYKIASNISVPASATLDILSKQIFLLEGDQLRCTADTSGKLQAVASYEVIS